MRKIFLLSFDDGTVHDRRFVELLNRYRIPCTFNLNSGLLGTPNLLIRQDMTIAHCKFRPVEVPRVYAGHEIAGHSLYHASPVDIGTSAFFCENVR